MEQEFTDPILELTETLRTLRFSTNERGHDALSMKFGVDAGSSEFAFIIFAIIRRIEFVSSLIREMTVVDQIVRTRQLACRSNLKRAFHPSTIASNWKSEGGGPAMLAEEYINGVEALQPHARRLHPIPRLSEQEVAELLLEVAEFRQRLENIERGENDPIRRSLIDGIIGFELSLKHFRWLGWENSVQQFKQFFVAYLIETHGLDPSSAAKAQEEAVLDTARSFIKRFWEFIKRTKENKETFEFLGQTISDGAKLLGSL